MSIHSTYIFISITPSIYWFHFSRKYYVGKYYRLCGTWIQIFFFELWVFVDTLYYTRWHFRHFGVVSSFLKNRDAPMIDMTAYPPSWPDDQAISSDHFRPTLMLIQIMQNIGGSKWQRLGGRLIKCHRSKGSQSRWRFKHFKHGGGSGLIGDQF